MNGERITVELFPTAEQAERIEKTLECCRELWNRMIEDEERLQEELGRHFIPAPARYKREMPKLKEADSLALAETHRSLSQSFQRNMFNPHDHKKPRKLEELNRYTTFCQQTRYGPTVRFEPGGLKLPKLGAVEAGGRVELPPGAVVKAAEVSKREGRYFCALTCEAPEREKESASA